MERHLIAPCGMNCGICMNFLRDKNKCPGCRGDDTNKPITRSGCKIKNCETFISGQTKYCYECEKFPCQDLEKLDKRYRSKYQMSMIENLKEIKEKGMTEFLKNETKKWTCRECGGTICVHKGRCADCGRNIINV